jgi:hypothetical protein
MRWLVAAVKVLRLLGCALCDVYYVYCIYLDYFTDFIKAGQIIVQILIGRGNLPEKLLPRVSLPGGGKKAGFPDFAITECGSNSEAFNKDVEPT